MGYGLSDALTLLASCSVYGCRGSSGRTGGTTRDKRCAVNVTRGFGCVSHCEECMVLIYCPLC